MKAIEEAIMNRYGQPAGAAFKAVTPGGLYNTEAPQKAQDNGAYAVFTLIDDSPEWTFTSECEDVLMQFTLVSYDRSVIDINDMFEKLKGFLDFVKLSVAGYDSIECRRQPGANKVRDPEADAWLYMVDYRILVQKQ